MTDFDHELIADLAEGNLPADEAADLEARIAADPVASAELEAQRVALAAIAAAPPPQLDDLERRRLHRSVAAELDLVLPERTAAPARRRWSVNWSALATAAAVLLGVALAAPLLSLLNTSDDASDATTTVVAAAQESADDAADGDLQARTLTEAPAETLPPSAELEAAAPAADEPAAATTAVPDTASPADTTVATGGDATFALGPLVDFGPLDGDLTVAAARLESPDLLERVRGDAEDELVPCVTEVQARFDAAGAPPSMAVRLLGTGTLADVPVYVLALVEGDEVRELSAVTTADCSEVAAAALE